MIVVLCALLWGAQSILNTQYTAAHHWVNWTLIYWSTLPQQAGIVISSSVYFKNVMSHACMKPCGAKVFGSQSNSTLTRKSIKFKSLCGFNSVCITHFAIYSWIRHIMSLKHVTTVPKGWIEESRDSWDPSLCINQLGLRAYQGAGGEAEGQVHSLAHISPKSKIIKCFKLYTSTALISL